MAASRNGLSKKKCRWHNLVGSADHGALIPCMTAHLATSLDLAKLNGNCNVFPFVYVKFLIGLTGSAAQLQAYRGLLLRIVQGL